MEIMVLYRVFLCFVIYLQVKCEEQFVKSKNPLPYFRRQVEEIVDDSTTHSSLSDDTSSNLVSFLMENIKKIYNELDESDSESITTPLTTKTTTIITTTPVTTTDTTTEIEIGLAIEFNNSTKTPGTTDNKLNYTTKETFLDNFTSTISMPYSEEIFTSVKVINTDIIEMEQSTTTSYELTEREELMHLSKNLIVFETDRKERDNFYYPFNASYFPTGSDNSMRSCIFCNNVRLENCNNPKNNLIPSTVCERNDDVCYSQHTPFGVVDRGCFNTNNNLTTYVCSCNLCNHISISEMPYIFSSKLEWLDNVVELSRTKHLRKSVFKDMSCLRCESNATSKTGDMLDTANCLEGNVGSLPTQECEENEICAVKAIKNDGYLWRGCVKEPLFNYWWGFCDSDLCNYDLVTSIYDIE